MSANSDRIIELFSQAKAKAPGEERERFLTEACQNEPELREQVESLLRAEEEAGRFLENARAVFQSAVPVTEKAGDRIGPYKLLQKLGEGGMGNVWMAEQGEPIRRMVALKVIKPGKDSVQVLARFEAERQAVALMDHPNIAKVFDAGSTPGGRPYFVMELVKGVPLTKFCDEQRLSIQQRLELFLPVCQAIQHAHQKGIIHRDIKPSNVLVALYDGKPVAKVIDFGIAKATGMRLTEHTLFTEYGALIGTPEYMSPEQAEMNQLDIDTRSDIYSLGVLLYELLTGTTPLTRETLRQAAFDEVLRRIREQEPPRPSTRLSESKDRLPSISAQRKLDPAHLTRLLRGDLDWIAMKCLEKDRSRRYETANGLAMDIQRHLCNEAVIACPPSNLYRFQKLVRRNKLAFSLGSAVAVSLVIGLAALTILFFREKEASRTQARLRGEAEVAKQKAEAAGNNAVEQAKRAEAAATETKMTLASSDVSQAVRLIAEGSRSEALAYLVRSLSANPTNDAALTGLATLLIYHSWSIPTLTFKQSDPVKSAYFSSDGKRILTTSGTTARVWDAETGQQLGEPLKHRWAMSAAQFSPDARRVATVENAGSLGHTARVWDAQSGRPLTEPLKHAFYLTSAQFSTDGKQILTSGQTARVWDAETGEPVAEPLKDSHGISSPRFSPDGKRIVTLSYDSSSSNYTARVWDAQTGRSLTEPLKPIAPMSSAQFSPDGKRIVTASIGGTARVWDAETGQTWTAPIKHDGSVTSTEFSPDGKQLVTASADRTARVWDAQTGGPVTQPLMHNDKVTSAAFSPDGKRIVTVDGVARVWDAQSGQLLMEPLKHRRKVTSAGFSPDGKRIITASADGTVRLWETQSRTALAELLKHKSRVNSAQFSLDGKRIVTASSDGTARVWDAQSGRPLTEPLRHEHADDGFHVVSRAQFSPDGRLIVTTSYGGTRATARVWDALSGQGLTEPLEHENGVFMNSAWFNPDGKRIVTAAADKTARVWDAQTGKPLTEPLKHDDNVNSAQFSPDGKRVVTASADSTARVWDAQTGKMVLEALKHDGGVTSAQFSPDGKRIVTASLDSTARVWDAQSGQPLLEALKHGDSVHNAQFSPDGKRIVTALADQTARVWDAETGQPITEILEVWLPQFSPDGNRIVTASAGRTARVWDTKTGQAVTEPLKHRGDVHSAQFSPDGKRIVTASEDGAARVWDVASAGPRCSEWLIQLCEAISGKVLNKYGVLEETKLDRREVIKQIREKLRHEPDDDDRVVWGRWFLADPAMRTISPYSKLTVPEYIEKRIKENTAASLAEAEELAFGNEKLLAQIAELRAQLAMPPRN